MANYATLDDLKEHGVPIVISEEHMEELLTRASKFIDRVCDRWFEKRTLTLRVDGSGYDSLDLPVPILDVTAINFIGQYRTETSVSQVLGDFIFYNRFLPDDRDDPHIVHKCGSFPEGRQNIELTGDFGYVAVPDVASPDLGAWYVPLDIKRACILLVEREAAQLSDSDAQDSKKRGFVIEEEADGHRYQLSEEMLTYWWKSGGVLTGDFAIDQILRLYRRPPNINAVF